LSTGTVAAFLRIRDRDEGRAHPQVGADLASPVAQAVYWRTAAVLFASSVRANPDATHLLFTNRDAPTIDGVNVAALLDRLNVRLVDVPFTYRPPPGYWDLWGDQFYLLDVIGYLGAHAALTPAVVLDVDCVFVGWGRPLFEAVEANGIANYVVEEIDSDPGYVSNGLTTRQLRDVAGELAGRPLPDLRYCGGEIFGATFETMRAIEATARGVWDMCLERHAQGMPKLNTEEHFFSHLYAVLGLPVGTTNGLIRRIWTQRAFRTARPSDLELVVWHLPAEKRYGLRRLFVDVAKTSSPFWRITPGPEFARYVGGHVGVPAPRLAKRVGDGLAAIRGRLPELPIARAARTKPQTARRARRRL
jgi:hypothetical protein